MNDWLKILIAFFCGFIFSYFSVYNIRQEDDSYTVNINDYYEFCNNDFETKNYLKGINNNFDLQKYINDINDLCTEYEFYD